MQAKISLRRQENCFALSTCLSLPPTRSATTKSDRLSRRCQSRAGRTEQYGGPHPCAAQVALSGDKGTPAAPSVCLGAGVGGEAERAPVPRQPSGCRLKICDACLTAVSGQTTGKPRFAASTREPAGLILWVRQVEWPACLEVQAVQAEHEPPPPSGPPRLRQLPLSARPGPSRCPRLSPRLPPINWPPPFRRIFWPRLS